MKIVIAGASTFGVKNFGDDAMLSCLVVSIREIFPSAEVSILLRHPDPDYGELFGIEVLKNFDHDNSRSAAGRFFLGLNEGDPREPLSEILRELQSANLVVLAGNSLMTLSEPSLYRGVSSYAVLIATLAMFCNTPYVLWGLNVVDPLTEPMVIEHARFLVGGSNGVCVREDAALQHLTKAIGQTHASKISIGEDPAWGLDDDIVRKIQPNHLAAILGTERFPANRFISINLRAEYWGKSVRDDEQLKIAEAAIEWAAEHKFEVFLVPNCVYEQGAKLQDDRNFHQALLERANYPDHVTAVNQELNVYETVKLLSFSSAHLTNRRHSAFFALMGEVPTAILSTSMATHNTGWVSSPDRGFSQPVLIGTNNPITDFLAGVVSGSENETFPDIDELRKNARNDLRDLLRGLDLATGDVG